MIATNNHSLLFYLFCILYLFPFLGFVECGGCAPTTYLDPLPPPSYADVLFPFPSSFSYGSTTYSISKDTFQFNTSSSSPRLARAIARYRTLIFSNSISISPPNSAKETAHPGYKNPHNDMDIVDAFPVLEVMNIQVTSSNEELQYGIDESYSLSVSVPKATLTANTVYGAIRGLETFSQLVINNASYSGLTISGCPWVIIDQPRYNHRGLLIDTSRHYLNVSTIMKTIDGLAYSKMNVLHWHIVDAQSFPLVSDAYPKLSLGSYTPQEVYQKADLEAIVSYATDRGVRVVVEIDSPGHTASWGVGYPEVTVCRDKLRQDGYCAENPCGELDPSNSLTFDIISALVEELTQIFPDNFFHFGADEVVFQCWNTTSILQWMQSLKLKNFDEVFGYFEQRVHAIGSKFNRTPVNWQEVFERNLNVSKDTIIQVWLDFATLQEVVQAGYRAILSNYQAWYLDCGFGNWCNYCTWLDIYNNDPLNNSTLTPEEESLILGGEVCLWGELVTDRNFDSKAWPRTAAAGERLWSPRSVKDIGNAFTRILKHNCRLAARGLDVDSLLPGSLPSTCYSIQE